MNTFAFIFTVALLLSTSLIASLLHFKADRWLVSPRKRSLRDNHSQAIPRLGGIGIALGFCITLLIAYQLIEKLPQSLSNPLAQGFESHFWVFLGGGIAAFGLGLADDLWNLRARYKLLGQILIALAFVKYGLVINLVEIPVYGPYALGMLGYPLTMLWLVGIMNAINLIDGLDGLAAGVAMIALVVFAAIALLVSNFPIAALCLGLVGATLGFWVFNRPPASIFMGDGGSLFLGYCLATLSLWAVENEQTGAINLLPILVLGVPILDTTLSLVRRYLKGIPFYSADKDHMHHRLLAKGYGRIQAMLILCGLSLCLGILAILVYWHQSLYLLSCLGAMLLGYFTLFILQYDEIKRPMELIRAKTSLKKQRAFVISLSENIDLFFKKDQTLDDLLKSFAFWASQMRIASYHLEMQQRLLVQYQEPLEAEGQYRQLIYEQEEIRLTLGFQGNELDIDTDVKGGLLDQVIAEFIKHLYRLEHPTVSGYQLPVSPLRRKEMIEYLKSPRTLN